MDNRIIHDPHLEEVPDHAGPHYDVLRNALTQNGMTVEQALQALNDSWTQNHNARLQPWDQQVLDNAAAALNQQQQANPDPNAPQEAPEQEQDRAEPEKKKPKMKDFDDNLNTTVGNYISKLRF